MIDKGVVSDKLLKALLSNAEIEAAGVDGSLRPEQLDLAAFVRLADQLAIQPAPSMD